MTIKAIIATSVIKTSRGDIVSLKNTRLKLLILSFFEEKDTLNLQEIAKKAGFLPDSLRIADRGFRIAERKSNSTVD